jgi:hypothetical protein
MQEPLDRRPPGSSPTSRSRSGVRGVARLFIGLAAVGAFLLTCTAPQRGAPPLEPDDFLLGGIPPESDSAEVRMTFGDPDSVVVTQNPFDAFEPVVSWYYPELVVRYSGSPVPIGFLLTGPGERTLRGVRVGHAGEEVLRRYGAPAYRHDPVWTYVDPLDEEGTHVLEFLVEEDTVRRIHIGRGN